MKTYIILKDPKPFAPDRVFEVPEPLSTGYINVDFAHAQQWYKQVYPTEGR